MAATVVVIKIQTTPCSPPTPFYAFWDGIAYELIPGQSPIVVPPLAYGVSPFPSAVSINNAASGPSLLFAAGAYSRIVRLQTLPGNNVNVYLQPNGQSPALNQGLLLKSNADGQIIFGTPELPMPITAVFAVNDSDTSTPGGVGAPCTVLISGG